MTDRSITLNAAHIRTVLHGLAFPADDHRRSLAMGVIADALTTGDEPSATEMADSEYSRRVNAVLLAADGLAYWWNREGWARQPSAAKVREFCDAIEALRTYAPRSSGGSS